MNSSLSIKIQKWQRSLLDFVVKTNPRLGLEARAEFFTERFAPYLPQKSQILDIGGGWGFYHEPLECRGHEHMVLDVVRPDVQKAPMVVYPGGRFPFEDGSFDVSMLITVLHHIADPEAVIAEARRVTQKRLIVVEDLYHHAIGRLWTKWRDQIFNFEYFGHAGQFRRKEEWVKIFEKKGFKLRHEEEVYTWLSGLRILNGILIFDVLS